jgi:hypothetical protein
VPPGKIRVATIGKAKRAPGNSVELFDLIDGSQYLATIHRFHVIHAAF